jgi:calcineurin-like phosphoesterase family protein
MPRTVFTSDSHVGHKAILSQRFANRRPFSSIEEHDEALVAAWNAVVRPDDIVWHLGDFAYKCSLDYTASVFSRLKGKKRLARGNHDFGLGERLPWDAPVVDVMRIQVQDPGMADPRQAFVSHYCHRVWPGMHRGHLHLYGHSHGALEATPGSLDVGVDCWNWAPVSLSGILERMAETPNFGPAS